jgi:2-dehydropantoate 2-reductase
MRVAIIGAGGIGGYFGASLARAGHEVHLFARGDHLQAIRSHGLEIHEPDGVWTIRVLASDDPAALAPADFAIVAVKSYSLAEVAPAILLLALAGAAIVPLLNGVETFEALVREGVAPGAIVPGLAAISVEKIASGVIARRSDFATVVVGERSGGSSERAERVARAFLEAGAKASVSSNIELDLWRKFLFLSTIAAACGLARASIGAVRGAPHGTTLLKRALSETAAVGRAHGVAIPPGEEESVLERILALAAPLKPSFLADLERGGPTELEVLSGAISRMGRERGIETPIHDTAVAAFSAATAKG